MREIKFRAYLKKKQGMFFLRGMYPVWLINPQDKTANIYNGGTEEQFEYPKEIELMQFTGLKDKNGKEIYEGDIVKSSNCKGLVEWRNNGWELDMIDTLGHWNIEGEIEVIGNIYENGEIFNKSK